MIKLILTIEELENGRVETHLKSDGGQLCTDPEKKLLEQINEVLETVCGKRTSYSSVFKDVPRSGP